MDRERELATFLHSVNALLGRELDEGDLLAWDVVVGDLPLRLALDALRHRVRTDPGFISPAAVRQSAQAIASERLSQYDPAAVRAPAGLSAGEYLQWLQEVRTQLIAGATSESAAATAAARVGRSVDEPRLIEMPPLPVPASGTDATSRSLPPPHG